MDAKIMEENREEKATQETAPGEQAREDEEQACAGDGAKEQQEEAQAGDGGEEATAGDGQQAADKDAAAGDGEAEAAPEPEPEPEPDPAEVIAQLKAAMLEMRMRNQAEFENYKKRLERDYSSHLKYAAEKVMRDLIPTLDNLELAITYGTREEACRNMLKGIMMTQKLLLDAVGRHGLLPVGKVGEPFDPARHEAVGFEKNPDLGADVVARVLQSGYVLQGRLLRPAKVMINKP